MLEPQHEHDCSGCVFLGNIGATDVWQCDEIDLVLRYGSLPEENKSLPIVVARQFMRSHEEWNPALQLYDAYMLGKSRWRLAHDQNDRILQG